MGRTFASVAVFVAVFSGAAAAPAAPPGAGALGVDARGQKEAEPSGPVDRRLRVVAFSDDGRRALVLEQTGVGVVADAVLVVDVDGVVLRLPLGRRVADGLRGRARLRDGDVPLCTQSAEVLSTWARDFQLASVRVGMCSHPDKPVLDARKRPRPTALSAEVGSWHRTVGFAGPTFVDDQGPLVVVIGRDGYGNDRLGVTSR